MISIANIDPHGMVKGWIIDRTPESAATRAEDGGKPQLAAHLRRGPVQRGASYTVADGLVWTMIAVEAGR